MIEKEVSEIRRCFRLEKNNITHIHACYVNERKEVISKSKLSTSFMKETEMEMYLALLKKSLSGTLGKTLIDIEFSTDQVLNSEEHKFLMEIKKTEANEETVTDKLFENIINSVTFETNYVILLAFDKYDIPYKAKDDMSFADNSTDVFSYYICCVCPVKETKPSLAYNFEETSFHSSKGLYVVSPPELGFMFPSFEDRATNIYHTMYYNKAFGETQTNFVNNVFGAELPMPATTQKELFQTVLATALEDECDFDLIQNVHETLSEMIDTHKVNKEIEPLYVSKNQVKSILEDCGVSPEKVEVFDENYTAEFGSDTQLPPRNIIDTKQFQLNTPNVVIKVKPEKSNLIKTEIINGKKYILIDANDGVEVNGVNIQILDNENI